MSDDSHHDVYRILDAAANRAGEGLRTLEEYARFGLDDANQSEAWKTLRHDLAASLARLPRQLLLSARDTPSDVGTEIGDSREYCRADVAAVIAAAATRTTQSLRTLEEYGKTLDAHIAVQIEALRYRCYTLAADLELQAPANWRRERLRQSHLYALLDCGETDDAFAKKIADLAVAGVDLFQLRDTVTDDRAKLQRARIGCKTAHQHDALFIVNDRADIAAAADADGVHVGQSELPAQAVRQIVGSGRLVGISTHSIEQARQAVADGADYVGYGPVFAGHTKTFEKYVGTAQLAQIANEIPIPLFAIGGIVEKNLRQVLAGGSNRVAVAGALRDADDPVAATKRLKSMLTTALSLALLLTTGVAARGNDHQAVDHVATLQTEALTESSGLAFSHRRPDRLWTHNDSGGKPRLYAFDTQGRPTGRADLNGATARDWEALSSFEDNGTARLLVGDCGDRPPKRESITLYLLDEPDPNAVTKVTRIQEIEVRYPQGPRDCEAVAVDVASRQILLFEKRLALQANVFAIPLPARSSRVDAPSKLTADKVTTVGAMLVTDADFHSRSGDVWVTNYTHALRFSQRTPKSSLAAQLSGKPEVFRLPQWNLIEAIAIDRAGRAWITHEGKNATLGRLNE